MKLTIVGASPSFENPGGASSSYLVETRSERILVDCGHGSVSILRTLTELRDITAIVISHMHPDHIFDLVPLTYAYRALERGRPAPPLYLPPDGTSLLSRLGEVVDLQPDFFSSTYRVAEFDPSAS